MAIIPQIPGQTNLQPIPAVIDTLPKPAIFGEGVSEKQTSLDPAKVFTNYFGRVHKKYRDMNTTNIENLVRRLLQEQNPTLMARIKKETYLRDTFKSRLIKAKTPLGEVLQELQNSQESPNRKLLSKDIFNQAEEEAKALLEKRRLKEASNEINLMQKKQTFNVKKIGPEFLINTYTTGGQSDPAVTSLSNGKFVVTWSSDGQDGDIWGVYGQIFNSDGTKSGSEFQVNTYTTGWQQDSSITSLSNGQFVITWESAFGQDGDSSGIYAQIFNSDGTKSGSEFQVNTYTTYDQTDPSVASLSNGKFIITWDGEGLEDSWGVYAQIFNSDGTKSGSEFPVNTYTSSFQSDPSVVSLSNGKFIITWKSRNQDGDREGIYAQIFNLDGTKSGSEFQVNTYTTEDQIIPSVATLSSGKFVITWTSEGQDGDIWGVYGQVFNLDRTKSGLEFQVNTYVKGDQGFSSVVGLSNGKFIITWTSSEGQDGDLDGVYGQIFNEDGTKNGIEFQVNTYTRGNQYISSVTSLGNDTFIITWKSNNQDGDSLGIYGQKFEARIIPSGNNPVSGAESQAKGIALTALGWMSQTVKGVLGY